MGSLSIHWKAEEYQEVGICTSSRPLMAGYGYSNMSEASLTGLTEGEAAFLYYGSFGLLDPKMPFEAVAIGGGQFLDDAGFAFVAPTLGGFVRGAGVSMLAGFLIVGSIGYVFDPDHRREGGVDDWDDVQILSSQMYNTWI